MHILKLQLIVLDFASLSADGIDLASIRFVSFAGPCRRRVGKSF